VKIHLFLVLLTLGYLFNLFNPIYAETGAFITQEIWIKAEIKTEEQVRKQLGDDWGYLDRERTGSLFRPYKLFKLEIAPIITAIQFWCVENWSAAISVLLGVENCKRYPKVLDNIFRFILNKRFQVFHKSFVKK